MLFPARSKPVVALLLIIFLTSTLTAHSAESKTKKNADDREQIEPENVVLLNQEAEVPDAEQEERIFVITDDDIDRMLHPKDANGLAPVGEEDPPKESTKLNEVFAEFTPEKQLPGTIDSRAVTLYENALEVLGKRRWSVVYPFDIRAAYADLEEAAKLGHRDAKKILGFSYLFGDNRWSIDEAREIFEELAKDGSPDANLGLGFIYSTGLGLEKPDPGRGLLHYTFSAMGGNPLAQMAVAYRHWAGINVAENCDTALAWYRRAARKVADNIKLTGAPSVQKIRIPDELENSASGSGTLLDQNVFAYYKYLAESGDVQAQLALAQLYLTGGKGVPMDLHEAAKYFKIAAEAGNSQAYAYLGRMFLEGTPATPQNNRTALNYFEKAVEKGNMIAQSGLGLMLLNGWGVTPNPALAMKLFTMSADQGSADGQFHVGQMMYHGIAVERNYKVAIKYFQLASQSGHILALYNLAYMHASGIGVTRSCSLAAEMLKNVAERGRWAERFMDAFNKYQAGATDEAAIRYLFLAELGYEVAQTNFAFIMDQSEGNQQLFTADQTYRRALLYWQRAANQEYPLARIKLGDYSYYGMGTNVDFTAAANHYKIAATNYQNPQAYFNLAYMHEQGIGVTKDLHLAKRFYDLAADTASEAFVPVAIALFKLRLLFLYSYFVENTIRYVPSLEFLDNLLGEHWDYYAMSFFFGIMVLLVFNYFSNRNQQQRPPNHVNRNGATNRASPQVPPASDIAPNHGEMNGQPPRTSANNDSLPRAPAENDQQAGQQ